MKTEKSTHFDTPRLRAISIVEVARKLGDTPRRVGINHVTHCPWHDDHHPSLSLVEKTGANYCHCFSCGKGGDVISFAMQHEDWSFQDACKWLSSTFGIYAIQGAAPMPQRKSNHNPEERKEPAYTYIPMPMVERLVSADNSLCQVLMKLFHPEHVKMVTEAYLLGNYSLYGKDNWTVFPSIDAQGRVCNLKVQHYDTNPRSPRYTHSDSKSYWLGKIWKDNGLLPEKSEFSSKCLFGEHLLYKYPAQTVALVESPKNAIVGALEHPEYLWVATGNKTSLQREVLEPLRSRDVLAIPDRDAIPLWRQTIKTLDDLANFVVSDYCEYMAPDDQKKFDVADHIISKRLQGASIVNQNQYTEF